MSPAQSAAPTAMELHSKFEQEFDFRLSYAEQTATFFEGLSGIVGSPNPALHETMAQEHCDKPDSREPFRTSNYSITTCSLLEWWWVVDRTRVPTLSRLIGGDRPPPGNRSPFTVPPPFLSCHHCPSPIVPILPPSVGDWGARRARRGE